MPLAASHEAAALTTADAGRVRVQASTIRPATPQCTEASRRSAPAPKIEPVHTCAFSDVLAALDGDRYLRLLAALDALLGTPPLTENAWRPARIVLVDALVRSARRVAGHLRAAADADEPGTHDTDLHEARKATKRLRYAAEVAVPVLGSRAARLASAANGVRDVLGGRQDAVVARPVWREIAVGSAGQDAFGYGGSVRAQASEHPRGGGGAAIRLARHPATAGEDGAQSIAAVVHPIPAVGSPSPPARCGVPSVPRTPGIEGRPATRIPV